MPEPVDTAALRLSGVGKHFGLDARAAEYVMTALDAAEQRAQQAEELVVKMRPAHGRAVAAEVRGQRAEAERDALATQVAGLREKPKAPAWMMAWLDELALSFTKQCMAADEDSSYWSHRQNAQNAAQISAWLLQNTSSAIALAAAPAAPIQAARDAVVDAAVTWEAEVGSLGHGHFSHAEVELALALGRWRDALSTAADVRGSLAPQREGGENG